MKKVSEFILVLVFCTGAVFATTTWVGSGDGLWTTPGNWDSGEVPDALTDVSTWCSNGPDNVITVNSGDTAVCQDLYFAPDGRSSEMVINGGTFTFRNMFAKIWDGATSGGKFTINGGVVSSVFDGNFGGRVHANYGSFPGSTMTFTQNGGLFDLDDAFIFDNYGNGAVYNLNGGVFDAKYIATWNGDSSGINQINFKTNGGTLVLNSYGNFTIDLLPKGYISIDGVRATDESQFVLDWETYPNRVGISVIPEPATFVLMGIGALVFARKK